MLCWRLKWYLSTVNSLISSGHARLGHVHRWVHVDPLVPVQPTLAVGAVPASRPQAAPDVLCSMEDEGGPREIIEASLGGNLWNAWLRWIVQGRTFLCSLVCEYLRGLYARWFSFILFFMHNMAETLEIRSKWYKNYKIANEDFLKYL
jgi:hypothetical protein